MPISTWGGFASSSAIHDNVGFGCGHTFTFLFPDLVINFLSLSRNLFGTLAGFSETTVVFIVVPSELFLVLENDSMRDFRGAIAPLNAIAEVDCPVLL